MVDSIFRAYDIRGLYPSQIDADTAKKIGRALVHYLQKKYDQSVLRILVGRDNRTHGPELQNAFIEGLLMEGALVDRVEDSCSPMIYHTVCKGGYDAGVNITASHNGPEYNGIKLVGKNAHSIAGEEIQAIKTLAAQIVDRLTAQGRVAPVQIAEEYWMHLSSLIQLSRPLKVVLDAGNGIAGKYYPELFRRLGCEVVELYCDQDGNFPNHQPDPVVESTTEDLKKKVIETGADVGIAFDGDGDRCAIVDEKGVYHDANQSLVLLARDVLSRHPGTPVIYTVSSSLIVPEEVKKAGGKPVMVPVGHSWVEHAMSEHQALIGGEQSGHFFVAEDYFHFDDAAYAAARLLKIFAASHQPVSSCYADIPRTFDYPEFRLPCPDDQKFEIVKKVATELSSKYPCETMDGVRADLGDGAWLGIRASNTSPVLSVIIEAKTEKKRSDVLELARKFLEPYQLVLSVDN